MLDYITSHYITLHTTPSSKAEPEATAPQNFHNFDNQISKNERMRRVADDSLSESESSKITEVRGRHKMRYDIADYNS